MPEVKRRVALLATVAGFGGAERVVLSLIEHIDGERFDVVPMVFTRHDQSENLFFKKLDEIGVKSLNFYADRHRVKYINPVANFIGAYRYVKRGGFDLIHTHGYRADVLGVFISWLTGLPVISTCHGFITIDKKLSLYNRLDKYLLRYFDLVMAVSEGIREDLLKSGVPQASIKVIPNAVYTGACRKDVDSGTRRAGTPPGIGAGDFVVGFVGRLSEEKGVSYLIEACSMLKNGSMPVKLLIIGDGPLREELASQAQALGMSDDIIFTGFQDDTAKWFEIMDVFVLPSLTEGTPMSLLEAMASGLPVVATAVGGVPDLVSDGANGILAAPASPSELKEAIGSLYTDKSLGQRLAAEAQRTVRSGYGIEKWISKVESLYSEFQGLSS